MTCNVALSDAIILQLILIDCKRFLKMDTPVSNPRERVAIL